MLAVITSLVSKADRYDLDDDEREWVDELARDRRDENLSRATMVILGLAASELRTAPAILALDSSRPHAVYTLLARADVLRSQFAELGRHQDRTTSSVVARRAS